MVEKIELEILSTLQLEDFSSKIDFDIIKSLKKKGVEKTPFDYFDFYTSISSVYSSKIEGEDIDMDSYMKHRFLNVKYEPDYTKKADDLFEAYKFVYSNMLNKENLLAAHKILSKNLLSESHRGIIRSNPMFVLNEEDRIEYVACDLYKVRIEFEKLFNDIAKLITTEISTIESFYFASLIHLTFVKIHPLQDGNGRTARLLEKWFLKTKLGEVATSIELERNYFLNRKKYYSNIKALGLEYDTLDYSKSSDFLLMTIQSIK